MTADQSTADFTPDERLAADTRSNARFFTASERPAVVELRTEIIALGRTIDLLVPDGRNKSLALTALEDVQMRANRALFSPEAVR